MRELGVGRIERVYRRSSREQDELGAAIDRFLVRGRDRPVGTGYFAHRQHRRAVPTELGRDGGSKQIAGLWLQALGGHDKRLERPKRQQLYSGSTLPAQPLRLLDQ